MSLSLRLFSILTSRCLSPACAGWCPADPAAPPTRPTALIWPDADERGARPSPGPDDAQSHGARVDSVSVSGFEMYFESWGAGRPLVLLHGAISTIEPSFGAVIPRVAQTRRLIAVEQQAHGRTADSERPLTYSQMAEDTATLVRKLKIDHADFFGYSMGAGIALELAVQYPQLVRRLVVASLAYGNDGFHPDTAAQLMETVTGG